jgi:hypothetical protein
VNATSITGQTPFHLAIMRGPKYERVADLLGSDVELKFVEDGGGK